MTMITFTNQQIFDRVYAFIVAQGKPAMKAGGKSCAYLSPDGCRCAVGCLFKDDEETNQRALAQGGSVQGLMYADKLKDYLPFDLNGPGQRYLLSDMQIAHDAAKCDAAVLRAGDADFDNDSDLRERFVTNFKYQMLRIAELFTLSFPDAKFASAVKE